MYSQTSLPPLTVSQASSGEMTYDHQEPVIEKVGPVLLKAGALTAGAAILLPALIALVGPFIG